MKQLLFSCLIFFLAISCVSSKKLMADKSKGRVFFGKTGGFTNIPMAYVLFDKGQLFKIQHDSLMRVRKLVGKQVKNLDSIRNEIDFKTINLNETGNITYYIKVVSSEFEKEIKWTDSSDNNKIKTFYKALVSTIKE